MRDSRMSKYWWLPLLSLVWLIPDWPDGALSAQCGEQAEAAEVMSAARQLLLQGSFDQLEEMARELGQRKSRLSDGRWKLTYFYAGLSSPEAAGPGFRIALGPLSYDSSQRDRKARARQVAHIESWVQSRPQSTTAKTALAKAQTSLAWEARGAGCAETLRPEQRAEFHAGLDAALETLASIEGRTDPEVHAVEMLIARGIRDSDKKRRAEDIMQRAMELEPSYFRTYSHHAILLLPRWGGEGDEAFEFAERAASSFRGGDGAELYTRIIMGVLAYVGPEYFERSFFQSFSWSRARQGFEHMEQQYPDSCWNLNHYALLASMARDRETARRLLTRIGSDWDESIWKSKEYFKRQRKWAGL